MASNDKLWFDMGVRETVSKTITDILDKAEELQDVMSSITIGRDAIKNAADVEQALDKIAIAKNRISEAKLLTNDRDSITLLNKMNKELDKVEKKFNMLANTSTDVGKAMMGTKGFVDFVKDNQNLALVLDQVRRLTGEISAEAIEKERQEAREAKRIDTLKDKYYELARARTALQDAILNAPIGTDVTGAVSTLNSLSARMGAVTRAANNGYATPLSVQGADYEEFLRNAKDQTRSLTSATDEFNKTLSTSESIEKSLNKMSLDTESQKKIAGIRKQNVEYTALSQKLREINNLLNAVNAEKAGIKNGTITTPTYTKDYVNTELEAIQRRYNENLARGKQLEKDDADAKRQRAEASKKSANAINLLAHANQGLISSYNRVAEAGTKASRISIQLQNQIAGYAGLYGIERIVKSIITIGGQFEYQHIALQNILGDIQQANTLFSQLQDLAVESPKTFMELTSYTKQLSAYQIPYKELYDTTKRLADISTGLGVDMSRLILAYGQVRSAAVLRGQELRQFTEAGIPLVQKLAEKFTQLNGRMVTTGEVFELISKRAVPFKMIQEILWDMTNEGGQFYDMQGKLADTLYGKWQKLQDQWQITLGHIAEGGSLTGKALKGGLEIVVQIAKAFDGIIPVIGMFGTAKFMQKTWSGLKEATAKRTGDLAIKNMEIAKLKEANRLERERIMYGKQLSVEEQKIVANKNKLVSSDYQILALENQITAKKAHQLMLDGKMSREHFYRLLQMQGYTREQRKQIANGNLQSLQGGGSMIGNMAKGAWNFMGGWLGVAMTAAGVGMSLWNNVKTKEEEARNAAQQTGDTMMSSLKSINSLYASLSSNSPKGIDETTSAIEQMTSSLKDCGHYTTELQEKIDQTPDAAGKYNILLQEVQKVSAEYSKAKENIEAYLEAANRVGEGDNWFKKLFNDPMSEDLKQLVDANKAKRTAKAMASNLGAALKAELKNFITERGDDFVGLGYEKVDWSKALEANNSNWRNEFKNYLGRKEGSFDGNEEYWGKLRNAVERYSDALDEAAAKEEEVRRQLPESAQSWHNALVEMADNSNLDISNMINWDEKDLQKFNTWLNDIIKGLNVDEETGEMIREAILKTFPEEAVVRIKALPVISTTDLTSWQTDLKNYFEGHKINIPIDAQTSLEKVEKQLQDKHKEYQEQMDRSGKVLISLGLDLSHLPKSFDEIKDQVPIWMRGYAEKNFADYNEGKTGIEKTEQAGKDLGLTVKKPTKARSGSQTDKDAKALREYIRIMNEAEKSFQYWRKTVGDAAASMHVNKEFGDELERVGKLLKKQNFKFEGIDQYKLTLEEIKKLYDNIYDKSTKKGKKRPELLQALKEVDKTIADIGRKNYEKGMEEYSSRVQNELDKMSRAWSTYKKLVESTGNRQMAAAIAFPEIDFNNINYTFDDKDNLATSLKKKIEGDVIEISKTFGANPIKLTFDINQSAEEIEQMVMAAFEDAKPAEPVKGAKESDKDFKARMDAYNLMLTDYQSKIKGVTSELKKWKDAQIDAVQAGIDEFSKLIGSLQDYDSQIARIKAKAELDKQVLGAARDEYVKTGGKRGISQENYDKATGIIDTKTDYETWKLGDQYIQLMNRSLSMTQKEIANGINVALAKQAGLLKQGVISAEEYAKECEKIRNIQSEWNQQSIFGANNALTAYIRGGVGGMRNWLKNDVTNNQKKADSMAGSAAADKYVMRAASSQTKLDALDKLDNTVGGASAAFDALVGATQPLIDIFEQLGMTEVGQVVGGVQSAMSGAMTGGLAGIALGGATAGPWGAAIGAGLSIASSVVSSIVGGHDEALHEQIEASKALKEEMESLSNVIEKELSRALGGVYGYKSTDNTKQFNEAINGFLRERWYNAGGGLLSGTKKEDLVSSEEEKAIMRAKETGDYFDQQYALLVMQKAQVEEMLAGEQDLKDPDKSNIAAYKNQIAELDDQIKNFALDMAQSLYDIDLKSWAQEFSDALVTAWENGENASEAYAKSVKSVMKNLAKTILQQKIMEEAFKNSHIDDIIAKMMTSQSGKLDYSNVEELANALIAMGDNVSESYTAVLDRLYEKGVIDKGESGGGLSSTIKAVTESTADLLASYINAIRLDVSMNRGMIAQYYPQFLNAMSQGNVIANAQLSQLQQVVTNTKRNADIAQDIYNILHDAQMGSKPLKTKS